jgi:hypothetical protein
MTTTRLTPGPASTTTALVRAWWPFTQHVLEMVAAMFVGMTVLGIARDLAGLTVASADRPGLAYVLMATDMSIGMAVWMRFRRHGWAATLEMCAAMYVPAALLPLVWSGAMSRMAFMVAAHVLMVVAMLAVMLRRRHELTHCGRAA